MKEDSFRKEIAEEALKLIAVDYEVLPAIFDPEEAMKPDALLIYPEYGTNLFHSVGDPVLCYQDYPPPRTCGNL